MPGGTCVLLGSARAGTEVSFDMPFLQFGRVVRGVIQGESHPQEFIPRLVDFLMQGRMPVDRMMTFYPLAEINRAAEDLGEGYDHQAGAAHAGVRRVAWDVRLCCGKSAPCYTTRTDHSSRAASSMNILLLGSGGREHALAWKIAASPLLDRLYCAPGNAGIAQECELRRARHRRPRGGDRVLPGARASTSSWSGRRRRWCAGIVDDLAAAGIKAFGPSQAAARLEGSKGFTKDLCRANTNSDRRL